MSKPDMQDNSRLVSLKNQLDDLERRWKGVPRKPLAVCRRMTALGFDITKEWNRMERDQARRNLAGVVIEWGWLHISGYRFRCCRHALPDARSPSDQSPLS